MAASSLIVLILIFIGVIMVVSGYARTTTECPVPKTIFKFVPRTFEEEQENPTLATDIFADMFSGSGLKSNYLTGFQQPTTDYEISRYF